MDTIADVTEDRPSAAAPDAVGEQRAALSAAGVAERRSLLVPVLSTACAALIAGVLGMAVVGFNALRDDMRTEIGVLRDDMRAEIGELRDEMRIENGVLRDDMRIEIGVLRDDMRIEIGVLRDDMNARFAQMDERFAQMDGRFAQMDGRFAQVDERFGEVNAIMLDHTERLARIETTLGVESPPAQQP